MGQTWVDTLQARRDLANQLGRDDLSDLERAELEALQASIFGRHDYGDEADPATTVTTPAVAGAAPPAAGGLTGPPAAAAAAGALTADERAELAQLRADFEALQASLGAQRGGDRAPADPSGTGTGTGTGAATTGTAGGTTPPAPQP